MEIVTQFILKISETIFKKIYLHMNKLSLKIVIIFILIILLSSCVSNKKVVYLQEKSNIQNHTDSFKFDAKIYKLQPYDIINIDIAGGNEDFIKFFISNNQAVQNLGNVGAGQGGDLFYTSGYNVNDSGFIKLPLIGFVKVSGLNIFEVEEKIEKKLIFYESSVRITVRLGGIRFSLLGEFNSPGKYVVMQNRVSIFDAIATGGDLKEIAKRDKVVLLRQYPNGAKIHYLSLLDKNILTSPYYFIQPNDVIYVEPLKRRSYGIGVNGFQTLTTILSIISTTLVVITFINQ